MTITKEQAVELGWQIATSTYTNRHYLDKTVYTFNFEALHTLVNAAIDLYKSDPKTNTSQERVQKTAKSEQMPLTDEEVQALAICREDRRVSVSKIQRKLCVGYSHAHVICQSIIDKGQCGGLLISPQLTTFGIKEPKV